MATNTSKRGGARPGSGRKPGVRDRGTGEQRASLEELARTHTEAALAVLVKVATSGDSDSAKVSAANAILDRGYGKPRQAVEVGGDPTNPLRMVSRIERVIIDADQNPTDTNPEEVRTTH